MRGMKINMLKNLQTYLVVISLFLSYDSPMKRLAWQVLLLVFSFTFIYIWQLLPISKSTLQVVSVLLTLYFLISIARRKFNPMELATSESWSIFFLNSILILLIFATGVFSSFLFFLLYFLIFAVAFVFEPITVFLFVLGVIGVFLPYVGNDDVTGNVLKLGSLVLLSPLAFYFGGDYKKKEAQERKKGSALPVTTAQELKKRVKEAKNQQKNPV